MIMNRINSMYITRTMIVLTIEQKVDQVSRSAEFNPGKVHGKVKVVMVPIDWHWYTLRAQDWKDCSDRMIATEKMTMDTGIGIQ